MALIMSRRCSGRRRSGGSRARRRRSGGGGGGGDGLRCKRRARRGGGSGRARRGETMSTQASPRTLKLNNDLYFTSVFLFIFNDDIILQF